MPLGRIGISVEIKTKRSLILGWTFGELNKSVLFLIENLLVEP
jgi:hypothetical protein